MRLDRDSDSSANTDREPRTTTFGRVPIKLWGDRESGYVNDWIFCSTERIHHIVFSLPPGKGFRHSEHHRTVFGADLIYYVLTGVLVLANPETGEVTRVEAGEAVYFRRDTWHHGFNFGQDELRVVEFFAPPPRAGMSQAYARTRPFLEDPIYARDELLERWPAAAEEEAKARTLHPIRKDEVLWRMEGDDQSLLVGILLSTENLTAGIIELLPGRFSEVREHGGDLSLHVVEGRLNVRLPDRERPGDWLEVETGGGFFAPMGTRYALFNMGGSRVRALFGVAPRYRPDRDEGEVG